MNSESAASPPLTPSPIPSTRPVDAPPLRTEVSSRSGPTVEHLFYALAIIVALSVRLIAIGQLPLQPFEALNAWHAWLDAMGLQVANAPQGTSALLHSLQTGIFWLFDGGGSNSAGVTLARIPVALATSLLVLLPWWWRHTLGRGAAAVLALLLAIDPWLLVLGRSADAAALSAFLALATLTALHVALSSDQDAPPRPTPALLASVALGLLLVSGVEAWSWLVVVGLYLALVVGSRVKALLTPANAIAFVVAALLGATLLLTQTDSLRMVSTSLGEWVGRFGGGAYGLGWPWIRLIVDQPLALFMGLLGIILVWSRPHSGYTYFLTAWLGWGALLLVLPGRTPFVMPVLGIALTVFAAYAIAAIAGAFARDMRQHSWLDAGLLAIVLVIMLVGAIFWGTLLSFDTKFSPVDFFVTFGLVALSAGMLVVFAVLVSGRQALLLGAAIAGTFLLFFSLSAATKLVDAPSATHPNGFFATVNSPEVRHLAEDVRTLSDRRKGDDRQLPVYVVNDGTRTPDPQLGWELRFMRNLRFVDSAQSAAADQSLPTPLIITPGAENTVSTWNQGLLGSPYRLRAAWLPADLPELSFEGGWEAFWGNSVRPWMRWLVYREATAPVSEEVNVWAAPQ